jgi:hypothetical protein
MIDHLITADEMEDLEVYSTWLDWTMTLSQLFDNNDAEQITSAVNKIRDTITGSSMFGMFALIALLSFLSWKKCCTKPSTGTDLSTPSAPPAAEPAANLHVLILAPVQNPPPTAIIFKKSPLQSITIINS